MSAALEAASDGTLLITFSLEGDLGRLRIQSPGKLRRGEHLWEHTCFEVFLAAKGAAAYHEFNIAPSSEWAAYAFRAYRDALPGSKIHPLLDAKVIRASDRLDVQAAITLRDVFSLSQRDRVSIGLSAVIEADDGTLGYWALRHPPGKPDFHHPSAFVLDLEQTPARAQ